MRRVLLAMFLLAVGCGCAFAQPAAKCNGVTVPSWPTLGRPSGAVNDQTTGYNTTTGMCESYSASSSAWVLAGSGGGGTPGGSTGQIQVNSNGTFGGIATTGTGYVVLSISPTLVTPTVTGSFTATGLVTNGDIAPMAAFTTKCNLLGSSASPTDCPTPPFTISNATVEPAFFVGPFAGASMPTGAQFLSGFAPYAGESVSIQIDEVEFVGHGSGIADVSGGGVAFGTSSCAAEIATSCYAIGADAMRDYYEVTDQGSMALGNGALGDGTGSGTDIAIGTNTIWGAAATITIANTAPHVGDVYTLSTNTTNACNGTTIIVNCTTNSNNPGTVASTWPATTSYTVVAGDTTATILAGHLATAWTGANNVNYVLGDGVIEGSHNLFSYAWQQIDTVNHPTVLKGHYPGSWLVTPTVSCAGTCTGAQATVGTGYTGGNNVVMGAKLWVSPLVTNPQFNTIGGQGGMGNFVTNPASNAIWGYGIAPNCSSCSGLDISGSNAGGAITTASHDVLHGNYAGAGITTGQWDVVDGDQAVAGSTCITTGSYDDEFGMGACVPSPTANGQLSLMNAIWGANNTGYGATASTGQIATEEAAFGSMTATELGGEVIVGTGSALATSATANFFHFPFVAAAPTGTPANLYGNACTINTATESINCYIGSSWYHLTMTSGAN